jgi:hypothetical protein
MEKAKAQIVNWPYALTENPINIAPFIAAATMDVTNPTKARKTNTSDQRLISSPPLSSGFPGIPVEIPYIMYI